MSGEPAKPAPIWRRVGLVWLALSVLLGTTLAGAYIPLGPLQSPVALGIAVAKAALVGFIFMELSDTTTISRLAIMTGLVALAVLFALTFADEVTRPGF